MATDPLDAAFAALADPTRRAILSRLGQGEMTLTDLARPFPMSAQAVAKHLRVLEKAGLISRGRAAQKKPCRLEPEGLKRVDDWLARHRALWETRLDRLGAYLRETDPDGAA
ncbi:MAG: metalloregulator ArsR/SmtB family transcription factor [Alphaproteobacteria bacterium]|nr:metalloregulator ArsR/SmtB family transcription factor [Alphaproteobacteria bacterium]